MGYNVWMAWLMWRLSRRLKMAAKPYRVMAGLGGPARAHAEEPPETTGDPRR